MDVRATLTVSYEQQSRQLTVETGRPQDRGRPLAPHLIVSSADEDVIDVIDRGNGLHEPAIVRDGWNIYASFCDDPALARGRIIDLWV
jgi:hypothetical protein